MSDVDEKLPGNGEAEAELRAGLITMAADLAGVYDLLVLTDAEGAQALEPLGATLLACALVVKVDRSGTINDPGAHAMMKAGEPALTWCSAGPDGRDVARRLHDVVPNLRHILTMNPAAWSGAPPLADLVERASSTKPPAIRRTAAASNGSTASSSHALPPVPPDALDGSPAKLAGRIIERYGADLLVVDDGDYGTGYALDASTGIWHAGGEAWARWLIEIADTMTAEVIGLGLTARALTTAIAHVHRLKRPGMVEQIRPMLRAMLGYLRDRGEKCANVTECRAEAIDADTRYLGTASGVVDLHAGELLPPETGRAALVTRQTAVEFDPAAHHQDVDRLFEHLDPAAVGWWWRVLGFHLLGAPSRRFYVAVGPPSGGKTTLANAIAGTLGPYASRPADDALEARAGGSAGLSPELEAFTVPRRWAIIDEAPRMKIAAPLLKRLSGDTSQTFRRLHEQLRTVPATATVLVICNPGSVPKLRLQDEAMADRLRELPYPAVPSPDPLMKHTIETPEFRRAFLARLVAAAAAETPRMPPDDVPVVRAATDERVREDVGELGAFARRFVRGAAMLTVADVWEAWCEQNEELADALEAGGIAKRRLSTALCAHVEGLPAPRPYSEAGRKVRGWRGWRLLAADEADAHDEGPARTKGNGLVRADTALGQLLRAAAPTADHERHHFRLLGDLLGRAFHDQDALYHVPSEDDQLGLPIPEWEHPGNRGSNGDRVTKEAGKWDSDGAPARVDFAPEWSQKTAPGRLLWLACRYPDEMGGAIGTAEFRAGLVRLIDEAALLVPEDDRAAWSAAAKADKHVARHLQEANGTA